MTYLFRSKMQIKINLILFLIILQCPRLLKSQNEYDVIETWMQFSDKSNFVYHYLADQAYQHLAERSDEISQLKTINDLEQYQEKIQNILKEIVGPFPEKSPLRPVITGKIKKEDYTVENVIFESQPGLYVTSSIFIPIGLGDKKAPAVLYCSGHTNESYSSSSYQHTIINLVKKGFIVLAFDPIGQGERNQYLDGDNGPLIWTTREHSYSGAQGFLLDGSKQAMYMIWDGIRAIDYLFTRGEVDTSRIGITGRSGGGTQASYIAAFDDRIFASAPEAFISNYTTYIESFWSGGDAERYFFNGIKNGISHEDLLLIRVPKPTLLIATSRDEFFPVSGFRETERNVRRIYELYHRDDNLYSAEDDATHVSTKKNREALYDFFQKTLRNPGNSEDLKVEIHSKDDLQCTISGNVYTTYDQAKTIFDLNYEDAKKYFDELNDKRKNMDYYIPAIIEKAKELSGYEILDNYHLVFDGRFQQSGFVIEKYFIKGEKLYEVIPYLLLIPDNSNGDAIIDLNSLGKAEEIKSDRIKWFLNNGYTVLLPDLLGIGELEDSRIREFFRKETKDDEDMALLVDKFFYRNWFLSITTGQSIVGIQASQLSLLVNFLNERKIKRIFGFSQGRACEVLLYTAAFDEKINGIFLMEPLLAYQSIVENFYYDPRLIYGSVAGALKHYDLYDLVASLHPKKLTIVNPKNGADKYISNLSKNKIKIIKSDYSKDGFKIITSDMKIDEISLIEKWLE